jgi:UDP-N-acetylmuramoylalanine--D-glutamate ligase
LAWQLDNSGRYGPPRRWLVVTGTNGKTTTTSMLHAMLVAAGRRALLCGNIGDPVLDVLDQPADLLAVELSSFQLHWAPSLRPEAGVVLNVAEDHLDWHGEPSAGELGVRDGVLVDNAFGEQLALAEAASIPVAGPVGVLDALAAAALARAVDVAPQAIADALAGFRVGRHRAEVVDVVDGVTYVDDSKATNPHAAQASIAAYPRVVWIAGGLLKGASVDELVAGVANRLVGAVLIGRDRPLIRDALSRHAPDVPVVEVVTGEDSGVQGEIGDSVTRLMTAVVDAARGLAGPGDTVLLAPAGASFDQFSSYGQRGDAFASAVAALPR